MGNNTVLFVWGVPRLREFKKPTLNIEIVGDYLIAEASTIQTRGLEVYKGINQFAKETTVFNGGEITPNKPSCGD
ncbi:hypothetical protein H257_14784 [Aphanomyces astaci]|uniref:Uncharacterized protein n=1 Tax=Aphanomyces astaci TaxID=112090 RepID=W4FSG2_APHAT|nr:hypothetical protein H257_14784 [Aphanomyces astaci]ETV69548.1 hypothetical protein H257_14784 [Aphanomyces astaci]|eukprot:XP_009840972.1 hypothetical protein H257_14784 [Aphanomyces astaci]